jgi:hypothetical protein
MMDLEFVQLNFDLGFGEPPSTFISSLDTLSEIDPFL